MNLGTEDLRVLFIGLFILSWLADSDQRN